MPDLRAKMTAQGAEPAQSMPTKFGAFPKNESEKWSKLAREVSSWSQLVGTDVDHDHDDSRGGVLNHLAGEVIESLSCWRDRSAPLA